MVLEIYIYIYMNEKVDKKGREEKNNSRMIK